jgi:PST family polysaccharide transporter
MLVAIIGVGEVLRDFGLANAAIQAREVTKQQRTNLAWINTGLGAAIGGIVVAIAPVVAAFYDEPALVPAGQLLAMTFLFNGIAAQFRADLTRRLRFVGLFFADVLPVILGLVAAIVLAMIGLGFWSLVWQQIGVALFGAVIAVLISGWLPGIPRKTPGMMPFLRYGLNLVLAQLVAYVSRNADYVILGYRYGPQSTGYYNRAFDLVINPLNQINAPSSKVAVPVLSRLQDDDARFDRYLLAGQRVVLVLSVPVLVLGACLAFPLVEAILGPRWLPTAPLVQILAVAAIARVASYATYWIALSRGATRISLYVNLVSAPIMVVAVLVGSMWGPLGVAWGFAAATTAAWFISLVWYSNAAHAPGMRMLTSALAVFSMSIVPAIACVSVVGLSSLSGPWTEVIVGIAVFVAVWLLFAGLVPKYRRDVGSVVAAISLAWKRGA